MNVEYDELLGRFRKSDVVAVDFSTDTLHVLKAGDAMTGNLQITADLIAGYGPTTNANFAVFGGMTSNQTTIPTYGSPFPDFTNYPQQGVVQIESEIITYTGNTGSSLTGCTRGDYGTSAVSHSSGNSYVVPIAMIIGNGHSTPSLVMTNRGQMSLGPYANATLFNATDGSATTLEISSIGGAAPLFRFWDFSHTKKSEIYAQSSRLLIAPGGSLLELGNEGASNTQGYFNAYGAYIGDFSTGQKNTTSILQLFSRSTTDKGLVITGVSSQSGNLTEWQNSSGTPLAAISSAGNLTTPNVILSGGKISPIADSTSAIKLTKADQTTAVMTIDTTNSRVGINGAAGSESLYITTGNILLDNDQAYRMKDNLGTSRTIFTLTSANNMQFSNSSADGSMQIRIVNDVGSIQFVTGATPTIKARFSNAGFLGIGVSTVNAVLHLQAGTATANTAPLKFNSGTNLTTAEAGTHEYNGRFTFTESDATRRFVVQAASSTKTTAAAPYVNDGYVTMTINGTDYKFMTTA